MLRARRPGLRTSGSPLKYLTEPELPRYVRIEEQHKARSRKRAREDRVSAQAVQAEKPCGVCTRETTHLMVFTSGGASTGPAGLVLRVNHRLAAAESVGAAVQSSSGLSKLTACGAASSTGSRRAAQQYPSRNQQYPSLTLPPAPFSTFDSPPQKSFATSLAT